MGTGGDEVGGGSGGGGAARGAGDRYGAVYGDLSGEWRTMTENRDELFRRVSGALGAEYELIRLLGRGGMASVFLARERALKRLVAIKVLAPELAASDDFRARFQREAETAARLQHPNIVPIYRVGSADGLVYYSMAYVDGESLGARMRERGRLPPEEATRITREIAAALGAAHRRGVVHRDIKPQNVLFDNESGRAHVTDFGIAQLVTPDTSDAEDAEDLTIAGMVMGTPRYMSPEQASGQRDLTPASDLYAVGVLLYEMLTGEYPYDIGPNRNYLVAHLTQDHRSIVSHLDDAAADVDPLVTRLLAKEPGDRFQTTDELLSALGSGESSQPTIPVRPGRTRAPRLLLAGAAIVVLALVAGWGLFGRDDGVPTGVDPRKSVLLGFFSNTSADRDLDWLRVGGVELLGQSLSRWEDLQIVGVDRLLDLARRSEVDADQPLSREEAVGLARAAGVWTATTGSLVQLGGDSIRITVRVYDVASESEITAATVAVHGDSSLTAAFDQLGREILEVSGVSAAALPVMEPPTRSIEAYRSYIAGLLARRRWDLDSAAIALRRAVDLDPEFAMAYYLLSSVSTDVQIPSERPKFLDLADSAMRYSVGRPTKERMLIEGFHAFVNADLQRAQTVYAEILAMDSTSVDAWSGLGTAAMYDLTLRRRPDGTEYFPSSPTLALRSLERTLELDAGDYRVYPILTQLLLAASQEEGRLPAFEDPPPGSITTLGRRVPTRWYQLLLVGDSVLTIPQGSLQVHFSAGEIDSLRGIARTRAEDVLQRWVSLAPDQGFAWLTLASVQHLDRKHEEAFASLAEARRTGLPSIMPYEAIRLSWLLEAQWFEEAIRLADSMDAGPVWGPSMDPQRVMQSMPLMHAALVGGHVEEAIGLERRRRLLQQGLPAGLELLARYQIIPVVAAVRVAAAADLLTRDALRAAFDSVEVVGAQLDDSARVAFEESQRGGLMVGAAALGDTAALRAYREEFDFRDYLGHDAWAAVVANDLDLARVRYAAAQADTTWEASQVFALARTAEALGRREEALSYYQAMDTLSYTATGGMDTDFIRLVRSYALRGAVYDAMGDSDAAKTYYRKFLGLWQEPDSALRGSRDIARQALAELERSDRPDN